MTLITDNPLPGDFNKAELNFDALLSRVSDTLESTDFPTPTFTVPQISADNRRITFDICLDPQGVAPGKYVGAITVGGPGGLSAGTVSLTVNAKAGSLFWIGGIISMVIAFLVLTLKGGEAEKTDSVSWGKAILKTFADLPWWATTLTALAAAFAALYAVYTDNPAWGAGGITDIVALIGAGFAAVGGQQILSTLTPTNH